MIHLTSAITGKRILCIAHKISNVIEQDAAGTTAVIMDNKELYTVTESYDKIMRRLEEVCYGCD